MRDDRDYDITPTDVYRQTTRWAPPAVFAGIGVVLVAAAIIIPGWLIGGWFQTHTIQRNYNNTVNSQQYQQTLISELGQHLSNIAGVAVDRQGIPATSPEQVNLRAQQLTEVRLFCSQSVNFHPQDAPAAQQLQDTINANCIAGAPVAQPPLADPVPKEGQ